MLYTILQPHDNIPNEIADRVGGQTDGNFGIFRNFQKIEFDSNLFSDNEMLIVENDGDNSLNIKPNDIVSESAADDLSKSNSENDDETKTIVSFDTEMIYDF